MTYEKLDEKVKKLLDDTENKMNDLIEKYNESNEEEELIISKEQVGSPGVSLMQKNTSTTKIRISWDSLATPGKVYEYDKKTKGLVLIKNETNCPN